MIRRHRFVRRVRRPAFILTACLLWLFAGASAFAVSEAAEQRLAANRAIPVESNEIENWPTGPVVGAESAILIEAETGTILYEKNIHQREYPASTTKILTTLIASEQCSLDEIVTFSHDAVFDTPRDSNHIAMDVGQELTMEQCLNAILIRSANEVCYAVAEHITGTTDWSVFADQMNKRAAELGCLDTHFTNPNGLPDENHYTTAYDLAMIGRAFFANEMLCRISLTRRMEFPATDKLPQGKLEVNLMELIPGGKYAYEYIVGCKTGYTSDARSCLVSCAEKNGLKLICVVLKDEAPYQYEDTISLFNYGFSNFEKVNVSQTETKYDIDDGGLFYGDYDIFGSSRPFLSLNRDDFIVLPRTADFQDTESSISYETDTETEAARITYTYHGVPIGSVRVNFATDKQQVNLFALDAETQTSDASASGASEEKPVLFINVVRIAAIGAGVCILAVLVLAVRAVLKNYAFPAKSTRRTWRRSRKRRNRMPRMPRSRRFRR